ncbi:MAG: 50S ribosomal protein L29, partial [Candidatus Micrarchaeia archaeon]
MSILKMKEIVAMDATVLSEKLGELKRELSIERSAAHGVGGKANPGRIKEIRRTVARILTFAHAKGMKVAPKLGKAPAARPVAKVPAAKTEVKKTEVKKPEAAKPAAKVEAKKPEAAKPAAAKSNDDFSQMVGE